MRDYSLFTDEYHPNFDSEDATTKEKSKNLTFISKVFLKVEAVNHQNRQL